ncbi:MAG: polyphosphate kinase 1 [Bacteroidota bacterium]|nr:polyphosphate kinase 1 [Bacteroidota bacterium]
MQNGKTIINRELSWLSFNERVLQEAADPTVPLAERIKFLGIFSNNLDEFFKVRVATIRRMIDLKFSNKKILGDDPEKLLTKIQETVIRLQKKFEAIYAEVLDELEKHNIFIIDETELNEEQSEFVMDYFEEKVQPALSPIMLRNLEKFPFLKDKSIYLATKLSRTKPQKDFEYALIEIPTVLPRFLVLPKNGDKKYVILLDDVIRYNLNIVFAIFDYDNFEAYTVKVTRDAELDIDNDLSKSFVEKIQKGVSGRKKGQPVRFVYDEAMPRDMLKYLKNALDFDNYDSMIPGGRYHNFKDFMSFPNVGIPALENPPAPPCFHPKIKDERSILHRIDERDILLHYPYQKFSHFINLLREAAINPNVKSIKITLYRVASNSKIINALINAARNEKEVTVIIELQARFDEQSNIYWSRKLEEAGVRVHFGIPGLKVHSKLLLITLKTGKKNLLYAGVSTGNFHEGNANVYTDVTLLTANKKIAHEVYKVFDFFENTYKYYNFKHLLVSPQFMRHKLEGLIDHEIDNAREGKNAYIILKINNLVDSEMITKLYQASQNGVKIKLIVRGICSLIPGVPGMSENIEAISIVDKYLEHARIFIFCNNDDEKYYISSADWMTRNLDNRVEVASPIYDPQLQKELRDIIDIQLSDNVKSRIIDECQANIYKKDGSPAPVRAQVEIYNYYKSQTENKDE